MKISYSNIIKYKMGKIYREDIQNGKEITKRLIC